jgi:hypothetical protein
MSKGSAPRPFKVDHDTFSNNFDAIFGKKHYQPGSLELHILEEQGKKVDEQIADWMINGPKTIKLDES